MSVTVLEFHNTVGGQARNESRDGYSLNLGPHALYQGGAGEAVLKELGVSLRGLATAENGGLQGRPSITDSGHRNVSATVERSPAATRQLAKRARDHVQQDRPRYAVEPHDVEALTDAFMIAALAGDLEKLRSLLKTNSGPFIEPGLPNASANS